jgi:phage shock protein A
MAAQQHESAVDHLDRKYQTIRHDLTVKRKELEELQEKFKIYDSSKKVLAGN